MGNTHQNDATGYVISVHPHARGEHSPSIHSCRPWNGSSPRPWGTPVMRLHVIDQQRFIPTPVGNTASSTTWSSSCAVHPHARGEHGIFQRCGKSSTGSSPRPWGTRITSSRNLSLSRFIPTPVGNTRSAFCFLYSPSVHPHARGEHQKGSKLQLPGSGSSPRPWGTHFTKSKRPYPVRFIPTPVGNTLYNGFPPPLTSVHPHARGEHSLCL